jgi:hypothetical protein
MGSLAAIVVVYTDLTFFLFAHHACALSLYCTSVNLSAAVDCIAAVECIALVSELLP